MSLKVYISADMEGITGVTHWNEVDPEKPDYAQFQKRMTDVSNQKIMTMNE